MILTTVFVNLWPLGNLVSANCLYGPRDDLSKVNETNSIGKLNAYPRGIGDSNGIESFSKTVTKAATM